MGQTYHLARSANMKDQRKCMVHVSKSALEDFGGFRKVPSQNTYGVRVSYRYLPYHPEIVFCLKCYHFRENTNKYIPIYYKFMLKNCKCFFTLFFIISTPHIIAKNPDDTTLFAIYSHQISHNTIRIIQGNFCYHNPTHMAEPSATILLTSK